jgi:hypothetical protein
MTGSDGIGYVAAALVLVTICLGRMTPLRLAALGSNPAFVAYGLMLGLAPVWFLHAILLPVNAGRLIEALRLTLGWGQAQAMSKVSQLYIDSVVTPVLHEEVAG